MRIHSSIAPQSTALLFIAFPPEQIVYEGLSFLYMCATRFFSVFSSSIRCHEVINEVDNKDIFALSNFARGRFCDCFLYAGVGCEEPDPIGQ